MVTRRRVHGKKRGLVDREQVLVFPDDRDVDRYGRLVPRRAPEQDELFGPDAIVRPAAPPRFVEGARPNDDLRARSARSVKLTVNEDVEPLAGHARFDQGADDLLDADQ